MAVRFVLPVGGITYRTVESPIGSLIIAGDSKGIRFLLFRRGRTRAEPEKAWQPDRDRASIVAETERQLAAYFAGKLRRFSVPLLPEGTPFQRDVWHQLQQIPYGETVSYGEIARRMAKPLAVRAVGLANGSNPIAIIIPCHRVIGSNGTLTGYGGGLDVKKALLALERGEQRLC